MSETELNIPASETAVTDFLEAVKFDTAALVPAIARQHDTGELLMVAWMNEAAIKETLSTGRVCYYSRSRQRLWRKGESSGQVQELLGVTIDCDGDVLLMDVDQTGVACHTGRRSCFFRALTNEGLIETAPVITDPDTLYPSKSSNHR